MLYDKLLEKEFEAAGLRGIIIEGTTPLPKDVKKWYYVQIPFGKGMLAGGLTLMLVILPVIIVSAQESIRAVSQEMRAGVLALGGTKWQAIEKVVLPSAIPGICTGAILALSRAIGEAAPILLIGYVGLQAGPDHLMAAFAALPLEIYQLDLRARSIVPRRRRGGHHRVARGAVFFQRRCRVHPPEVPAGQLTRVGRAALIGRSQAAARS